MTTPRTLFAPLLAILACALAGPAAEAATVKYYHLDAVGNVLAVTRADGAVLETHDYLPYGEEWCAGAICGSNLTPGQPLRFTGKERDTETGLDYFGARYYGSRIGRFTTIDPMMTIDANLLDPQRWNRYSYALNSPMRFNDPDGRSPKLITGAIKLAIKGGDIYSTVSGIVDAGSTVFSLDPNVGTGERALATGMLLLEISGISDVYAAGKGIRNVVAQRATKLSEMTAAQRRAHYLEQGVAATDIGPSGYPKVHAVDHPTKKAAREAAERRGKGDPMHHPNPADASEPHYHATDAAGEKALPNVHDNYPKSRK